MTNNEAITAIRKMFKAISAGDVTNITDHISKDYVNLEALGDSEDRSSLRGPDAFIATVKLLRSAFSDIHYDEQEIIGVEDKVTLRTIETDKHTGPFFGIAPHRQEHYSRASTLFPRCRW